MTHFDTLTYARALKEAGVPEQQAEAHAVALRDIVIDEVATKAQLEATEAALKADIAAVKADLDTVGSSLKADIAAVETALKTDIAEVKADLKRDIEVLRENVDGRFRLLQWMVGFVLAMVAALLWMTIRGAV